MDQKTDRTKLEVDKLSTEIEKLREDVAKTRQDRGLYNRHLPALGPLLGVLATFIVGYVTYDLGRSQQAATESRERSAQRLREREDERQATEAGLRLAQFALANRSEFLEGSPDAQGRFVGLVTELLDPEPRAKLLAGLKLIATQAPVLDRIGQAQRTLPRRAAPPAEAQDTHLTLYAHVARPQDRDDARRILDRVAELDRARNLSPAIDRAVIEVVPSAAPLGAVELRFYHQDQRATAEQVAGLLREAVRQEGVGGIPDVSVQYVGDRYGALPRGRAEVWFPPLAKAAR